MTSEPEPTQKQKDDLHNGLLGGFGCLALIVIAALGLTYCSSGETETISEVAETVSFEDSVYKYCMQRDERWLMNLMARVRAEITLSDDYDLRYQRMHTSSGMNGTVIDETKTGLTILTTAPHEGEISNLWVWGNIDPDTCEVGPMTGRFAPNQFDDRPTFEIT